MKKKYKIAFTIAGLIGLLWVGIYLVGRILTPPAEMPLDVKWVSDEDEDYHIAFWYSKAESGMVGEIQLGEDLVFATVLTGPGRATYIDFYLYDPTIATEKQIVTETLRFLCGGKYQYKAKRNEVVINITHSDCHIPRGKIVFHADQ